MTAESFCYWLQGYFEISGAGKPQLVGTPLPPGPIPAEAVEVIQRHLSMVFIHDIDPKAGGPEVQAKLNGLHNMPPGARC